MNKPAIRVLHGRPRRPFGSGRPDQLAAASAIGFDCRVFAKPISAIAAMGPRRRRRRRLTGLAVGEVIDVRVPLADASPDGQPHRAEDRPGGHDLSIVVPAYNESHRLPILLGALERRLDLQRTEIIVVDDGSSDDTTSTAERHTASWAAATVLTSPMNQGKGAALRRGVQQARGRSILFMDADNATDLDDLPALLGALSEHHVAIGSRTAVGASVTNGQWHRRLMGRTFGWFARIATGTSVRDTQCGFKAFRGSAARLLFDLSQIDGFAQDVEILDLAGQLGFSVAEVPVHWTAVPGSKVAPVRDGFQMVRDVLKHRLGRARSGVTVAGLTLPAADRDVRVLAKEAGTALRATDPVIVADDRVHVLLPNVDDADLGAIAGRIAAQSGAATIMRWSIDAQVLLPLTDPHTRDGLARLGEPLG